MLTGEKSVWQSKTIWGSILVLLSMIAGVFGYTITPEDQVLLVEVLSTAVATVGAVIAIFGRITASKQIK